MYFKRISHSVYLIIFLCSVLLIGSSCSSINKVYHNYVMRGTILDQSGNEVYLCIGSKDGAQVGQIFIVYEMVRQQSLKQGRPFFQEVSFKKEKKGTIKISELVDEHYAKGIILSGTAQKNFIVELENPKTSECE